MSLFRCPICRAPLTRGERTYTCPKGHSFDRAREGYVHLLPANRKNARDPGDDKGMAAARHRFLSGGWYAPLREALSAFATETQKHVTGQVKLKLYKGNIITAGVTSPETLYSEEIVTFQESDYNQNDATGFINLWGLPDTVLALRDQGKLNK